MQPVISYIGQSSLNMKLAGTLSMVVHGLWWKSQALKQHLTFPTLCSAVTTAAATKSSIATMAGWREKNVLPTATAEKGSQAEPLPEQVQGEVE